MNRFRRFWKKAVQKKYLLLLMVPGIIYYVIFRYLPMYGIVIAFKDFMPLKGIWASPWAGMKHFNRLFSAPDFLNVVRNTLLISIYKLIFYFPFPIILSLMLNELRSTALKKASQTIFYLPHFLSWVIFSGIVQSLLSSGGLINYLITALGGAPKVFLADSHYFRGILVITSIWKEAGWNTIIYLAAIAGINPELYEAAIMDGAGRLKRIWHVTLPCIRSTIAITLILRLGSLMDAGFEQVLLLYNVAVYDVGDIIGTFVYRMGITRGQMSYTTAADLFRGVVGILLIGGANIVIKRMGEEGLW